MSISEVITESGWINSLTLNDYLHVHNIPNANFIAEPTEINNCQKTINLINLSTDYDSLVWNFGDGFTSLEDTNEYYSYENIGLYTIELSVTNEFGCENKIYRQIKPSPRIPFYAPNSFTPDGDDLNEKFIPQVGCTDLFELWIMNRWGEVIFYSNDKNLGWDGTYKSKKCPQGIYSWKVRFNGSKANQIKLGEVHLID